MYTIQNVSLLWGGHKNARWQQVFQNSLRRCSRVQQGEITLGFPPFSRGQQEMKLCSPHYCSPQNPIRNEERGDHQVQREPDTVSPCHLLHEA
mmetsp:Transcript_9307/g.17844  ORF Transcript_9307/g.17844 Transcript_9307/m.17844 type:complete len:93 (-) Transcript_9307:1162-1440(-)